MQTVAKLTAQSFDEIGRDPNVSDAISEQRLSEREVVHRHRVGLLVVLLHAASA